MNLVIAILASRVGLRVRVPTDRRHIPSDTFIKAGTLGTTTSCTCAGAVVGVRLDGREDELDMRFDSLELVDPSG